jgi:restriction endonuclease S subunit
LFELEGDWTVDSHVAILRPRRILPRALVYLLASPIGQVQFQKAESGATGQTTVTEEDLRRFVFPKNSLKEIESIANTLDTKRTAIHQEIEALQKKERIAWEEFTTALIR